MRVRWISKGVAARDETAFSHALKIGYRLRKAEQRLTDAAIIDAYEHAYNVAQEQGSAGRSSEMPPMRDRQTMARRVRGYVTQSKNNTSLSSSAPGRATSSERKACHHGAQRRPESRTTLENRPRWRNAQNQHATLTEANKRRAQEGKGTRGRVLSLSMDILTQTGKEPTGGEVGQELGITRQQANRHLKALREIGLL